MEAAATVDNPASAGAADNLGESSEPGAGQTGTDTNEGQAQGGAPDDIFKGIDPRSLPPQAKAAYDSMLKDYRDKTGRLSETIKSESAKAAEAYKSKAELYEQIAGQEEFVKRWNDYVKEKEATTGKPPQEGDPALQELKEQFQQMNQKLQQAELSKVTDAFADAMDEKGNKIHSDFDALNGFMIGKLQNGKSAEEYSLLRASIELAPGRTPQEKLANGYKSAKALHDSIFEAGRKAGMGRQQAKLMNGSLPPTNSGSDALSVTEKKPKNAHEAMQMARKGIIVSRD